MDFSIIIPAKNEEKNIGKCLDSIYAMDFDRDRFEVIVIDNGSSDRTVEIVREKGTAVFDKPDLTISGLRNFGSSRASGRILAFLDADCTVEENWLNEASRYLEDEKVICFGAPPIVPVDATWVQKAWFQVRRNQETVQEAAWFESMNMFVRREAFVTCGGFDEDLVTCEDYDLSLRLKKIGRLQNDNRIVAVHHGEAASVEHFFRKEKWRGMSNFRGLKQHGIVVRELPSLVAPIFHCLLLLLVVLSPLFISSLVFCFAILFFVLWQIMIFVLSFRKNERTVHFIQVIQLYWLLNVYFTARGFAVFGGK